MIYFARIQKHPIGTLWIQNLYWNEHFAIENDNNNHSKFSANLIFYTKRAIVFCLISFFALHQKCYFWMPKYGHFCAMLMLKQNLFCFSIEKVWPFAWIFHFSVCDGSKGKLIYLSGESVFMDRLVFARFFWRSVLMDMVTDVKRQWVMD